MASICSGFVAPVMTEATGASESSQPIASSSNVRPRSSANRVRASTRSNSLSSIGLVVVAQPGARRRRFSPPVLAGEHAAREREVGDVREPLLGRARQTVGLVGALQQAQLVLHADESRRAVGHGVGRLALLGRREVRAPDLAHEALADEIVQHGEGVRDRHGGVGLVQLIQVDVVGLESLEAVVQRATHVGGRRAHLVRRHLHPELGREHDPIATAGEDPTEERLAASATVDVGRVEEGHAGVQRCIDDAPRAVFVDPAPEVVAPEPDDADRAGSRSCGCPCRRCYRTASAGPVGQAASRIVDSQAVGPVPRTASRQVCRNGASSEASTPC